MAAINFMNLDTLVTNQEVANATMTASQFDKFLIKEEVIRITEIAHIRSAIGEDFYDFIKVEMNKPLNERCWYNDPDNTTDDDGDPETPEVSDPIIATCESCDMDGGSNNGYQVWIDSYLKPALCWFVKFEALNDIQYNTNSSGVQINLPEYSQPIDVKTFNAYKQDVYRKAVLLLEAAMSFLNDDDNDGCFPEYESDTTGDGYNCEEGCGNKGLVSKNHGMIIY